MEQPPPAKRQRKPPTVVPEHAKRWFLAFAQRQKEKESWPLTETVRVAADVCPELFQGLHSDTPRKWAAQLDKQKKQVGRHELVDLAVLTRLSVLLETRLQKGVCF